MDVCNEIKNLIPYRPGKPISETQREYGLTHVIKLASNENPLGPSPKAKTAMSEIVNQLHYYPDPMGFDLIQKLSKTWSVASNLLTLSNGSNEAIDILIRIFCDPRGEHPDQIAVFDKSFIAYPICAQAARIETVTVPLSRDEFEFKMDLNLMAETLLKNPRIKIVFLPNPNNPTGRHITKIELESFLKKVGHRKNLLIVFDEAYFEFVEAHDYVSAVNYMKDYPSVVVLRTFSKIYGLAGLRLGVMLAQPQVNEYYHRVRNPFNTSLVAQAAAVAALDDFEFVKRSQELVWIGKKQITKALNELKLTWIPSEGNFILFDTKQDALKIYESLLKLGIILRPVFNYGLPTYLRWTIGSKEENQAVIDKLKQILR